MNPAVAQIAVIALQALIQEAPGMIMRIREIVNKENPTKEDWEKLKAEITADTYEALVTASRLPKEGEQPANNPT